MDDGPFEKIIKSDVSIEKEDRFKNLRDFARGLDDLCPPKKSILNQTEIIDRDSFYNSLKKEIINIIKFFFNFC